MTTSQILATLNSHNIKTQKPENFYVAGSGYFIYHGIVGAKETTYQSSQKFILSIPEARIVTQRDLFSYGVIGSYTYKTLEAFIKDVVPYLYEVDLKELKPI